MSSSLDNTQSPLPSSKPNKRSSTSSSELERPIKRLHLSANPAEGSSNLGISELETVSTDSDMTDGLSALDALRPGDQVHSAKGKGRAAPTGRMDIDGDGLIPLPKKWKGKGKQKVCPLLPDDIWRRVFEFLFDSYRQDWLREVAVPNTLDSLLICKDLGSIAASILYSHPHIHYDAIPRFIHSFPPSDGPKDGRLSHTRDVTIRPSPTYFALSTGATSTLHPRLGELFKVLPDQLNSLTMKKTLIIDNGDRDDLFAALKLVKPRKARLEIRFWDLSKSPIGRDLLAATRPGPYFTTSASFRRTTGEGDANGAQPQRTAMPPIVILPPLQAPEMKWFQELWRTAMIMRDELEIPMRWLEDEREVQAQAQAAQAAQLANQGLAQAQFQAQQAQLLLGLNNNPGGPGGNGGAGAGIGAAGAGALPGAHSPFTTASAMLNQTQAQGFPNAGQPNWRATGPGTLNARQARADLLRNRVGSCTAAQAGTSSQGNQAVQATVTDGTSTTADGSSTQVEPTAEGSSMQVEPAAEASSHTETSAEESTGEANVSPTEEATASVEVVHSGDVMPVESASGAITTLDPPAPSISPDATQADETLAAAEVAPLATPTLDAPAPAEVRASETSTPDAPAPGLSTAPEITSSEPPQSENQSDSTARYNLRSRDTTTQPSNTASTNDTTTDPTEATSPAPFGPADDSIGYPMRDEDRDRVTEPRAWLERFSKRVGEGTETKPGFKWIPKEEASESAPNSWFINPKPEVEEAKEWKHVETVQLEETADVSAPVEPFKSAIKEEGQAQDVEMKEGTPDAGELDGPSQVPVNDGNAAEVAPSEEILAPIDQSTPNHDTTVFDGLPPPASSSGDASAAIDGAASNAYIVPPVNPARIRHRVINCDRLEDHARFTETVDLAADDADDSMGRDQGEAAVNVPAATAAAPESLAVPSEEDSSNTDVEDENMQEALYQSRVEHFAGFADPPPQVSQNSNLLAFASASSGSTPTVPPPNTHNLRYIRRHGSAGSSTAVVNLNDPNNIITGLAPPIRFASAYLPHTFRETLFQLFDQHWCPEIQAFSLVALDPHASVIAQAPRLDFWNRVAVPRIRVHLPRCINSLAVFKGLKENRRDRRKRQRDRLLASAPAGNPADTEVPSDDHIIVGGDGEGGGLVHESNRLFEIEVNTVEEMEEVVWIQGGDQLPPQVCRILAGSHEWNDVPIDFHDPSPSRANETVSYTSSPATSQFASPTFSWADESGEEVMSEFDLDTGPDAGANYDAKAARAQHNKQKSKLVQVEGADEVEMEDEDQAGWIGMAIDMKSRRG